MELAHLDGHIRKGLHKTSSRIADNTNDVPSALSQGSNACNIFSNRFVWEKFPEKILVAMGAAEHHDAEDFSEVRCIHHNHNVTGSDEARLHLCAIHLLLHPPPTSTDPLPDLRVCLFPMSVRSPELPDLWSSLLSHFPMTGFTEPQLPACISAKLLQFTRIATRTYFSWCIGKNLSISPLAQEKNPSF